MLHAREPKVELWRAELQNPCRWDCRASAADCSKGNTVGSRGCNPRITKAHEDHPGPDGAVQRRSKQIPFVKIYSRRQQQYPEFLPIY